MQGKSNCESCYNYLYDEEYDYYECQMSLDEDEMRQFLQDTFSSCPYFQYNNEYKIVRKQI
jgi:hypothetical protein